MPRGINVQAWLPLYKMAEITELLSKDAPAKVDDRPLSYTIRHVLEEWMEIKREQLGVRERVMNDNEAARIIQAAFPSIDVGSRIRQKSKTFKMPEKETTIASIQDEAKKALSEKG